MREIEAIKSGEDRVGWNRKFKNCGHASRLHHPPQFRQALVIIREVSKTEGNGQHVERMVRDGKTERVGFEQQRREMMHFQLGTRRHQHWMAEIAPVDSRLRRKAKRDGQVSCAATDIEYAGIARKREARNAANRARTPVTVEIERE